MTISISKERLEKLLFDTLLQYKQDLGLKTVMRVAGGWVRDKVCYF
jgi:tRNA nucleotidyltransferase/poly(A) polymerase